MFRGRDRTAEGASSPEDLVALQRTLYSSRNPTRRWLHTTRRSWVEDQIRRAGPGERALEVGPGYGVYLPTLRESFAQVTASDVETAHLGDLAHRFPEVELVRDDIRSSGLDHGRFDLILCSEVVEHIPESPLALKGMFDLLQPGGILLLSTPQRFSPLEVCSKVAFLPGVVDLVRWIYREPILKQGHVNLMTRGQARGQLEDAGFRITQEHFAGFYLPFLAEFGGNPGLALAKLMERALRGGPLQWLLWTQHYVAEKPG